MSGESGSRRGIESDSRYRSRIEFCIEAFVEETAYVPAGARLVRGAGELSPELERLVGSMSPGSAWRAWVAGPRAWFVQGRLGDRGAGIDRPTVSLIFHDHDALPVAGGVWRRGAAARWDLLRSDAGLEVDAGSGVAAAA